MHIQMSTKWFTIVAQEFSPSRRTSNEIVAIKSCDISSIKLWQHFPQFLQIPARERRSSTENEVNRL